MRGRRRSCNWAPVPEIAPALDAAERYAAAALAAVRARVVVDGAPDPRAIDREQRAVHGFAWIETTLAALRTLANWSEAFARPGSVETLVVEIGCGEYLAQLSGGIPMGQNEYCRPADLDIADAAARLTQDAAVARLIRSGNRAAYRAALVARLRRGEPIAESPGDATLDAVREQFRRFTEARILPHAHRWHLDDALIPDAVVAEKAAFGI